MESRKQGYQLSRKAHRCPRESGTRELVRPRSLKTDCDCMGRVGAGRAKISASLSAEKI